ncbi:CsbD family protein [Streptomyces sp. NBC_01262]|uniref:CsbD family protein n=1 Tax=Streptomyces sp. NBC_01262 TaxID=2903803 RepID=UPI002E3585B1|nr:CsbD family protein [Streptomyces sp. NBC_01262]
MDLGSKLKSKTQVAKGRIKEGFGRATGNKRLKREGMAGRVMGNLRQSGEKAKAAFKR